LVNYYLVNDAVMVFGDAVQIDFVDKSFWQLEWGRGGTPGRGRRQLGVADGEVGVFDWLRLNPEGDERRYAQQNGSDVSHRNGSRAALLSSNVS
jgi:hypothetical protein